MFKRFAFAFAALFCATTAARAADWGTLTGHFVYEGTAPKPTKIDANKDPDVCGKHELHDEALEVAKDGSLQNALIYLRTDKVDIAPEYKDSETATVVLDNKNCRFEPHVLVMRNTQTLELKNSDPVAHNSKVEPLKSSPINPIIPAGEKIDTKLSEEENLPIKVGCNIHPWMGGWVLVRKTPYAAASNEAGKFEIKDLPAGKELEFQLWQEKAGFLKEAKIKGVKVDNKGRFKLKIKPGENDLGDIKVSIK